MKVVAEYAEAMERGDRFPPIIVFYDRKRNIYFVADGFHRLLAHLRARTNDRIQAEMRLGTEQDALWFSVTANTVHGLQRTGDDKRRAVELALLHPNGKSLSDRKIADHVDVSHPMVQRIRKSLEDAGKLEKCDFRIGADGRTYKINRKPPTECVCADCGHYKSPKCLIEGEMREPTYPACEDFIMIPPPELEMKVEEAYDPRSEREYVPTEIRHRVSRRPPGEYIAVPLSRTNADLAAVEIRHFFDETYAEALGQALLRLVRESTD